MLDWAARPPPVEPNAATTASTSNSWEQHGIDGQLRGPAPASARQFFAALLHMLEDRRASMLQHPWSSTLLPGRTLGPNMSARLELLSRRLSVAGAPRPTTTSPSGP